MSKDKIHLNIKIFGKVQGVGFRFNAKDVANRLGLAGFIKNESDGSVYIEVEGNKDLIDKFTNWCKNGPDFARVKRIEKDKSQIQEFSGFEIKY